MKKLVAAFSVWALFALTVFILIDPPTNGQSSNNKSAHYLVGVNYDRLVEVGEVAVGFEVGAVEILEMDTPIVEAISVEGVAVGFDDETVEILEMKTPIEEVVSEEDEGN
ncbi:hypothetical protein [Jeotgalibacillus marinus]|uniref:Uncharacterized protein n=1 Tax=Jeotgalibacillus marinus TaxID=86667 RepID=A0ABV3Q622_9BACL